MATQKQQLLKGDDGFYVGSVLKSGELSSGAYKISNENIVMMFTELLQDYCLRNKKPMEIMRNGKPFIRATLVIE